MDGSETVLLSLGSNLGDRDAQIQEACELLNESVRICERSKNFYSSAMGFEGPDFINIAILGETLLSPIQLLNKIKEIEKKMGKKQRERTQVYRSRPIDIDIVFFGQQTITKKELEIPHPEMHKRDFVLVPASEIAGEWMHPCFNKSILQLKKECDVHSH